MDNSRSNCYVCGLPFVSEFRGGTCSEIWNNVSNIFLDPAHETKGISEFIQPILWFVNWFKPYFILFGMGVLFILIFPKWRKQIYMGLILLSVVLLVLLAIFKSSGIGKHAIMWPLTLLGALAFYMTKNKSWDLFYKGWMTGIVYAFCMNLSSNQGIYVICNACTISSCISLFLIKEFFDEHKEWSQRSFWLAGLVAVQLLSEVYVEMNFVYGEEKISLLAYKTEQGPFKGIYTTKAKQEIYNCNYENIKALGNLEGKNIVCFNGFPSGYLVAENAENAAFSAWQIEYGRLDDERIMRYYELHPEKIPEVIYIDTWTVLEWDKEEEAEWCKKYEYTKIDFPKGGSALILE